MKCAYLLGLQWPILNNHFEAELFPIINSVETPLKKAEKNEEKKLPHTERNVKKRITFDVLIAIFVN